MVEDTYNIYVVCDNCDYRGYVKLKKKLLVKDVLKDTECPTCECKTLSKKTEIKLDNILRNVPIQINRPKPRDNPFKPFPRDIPFNPFPKPFFGDPIRKHKPYYIGDYPPFDGPFTPKFRTGIKYQGYCDPSPTKVINQVSDYHTFGPIGSTRLAFHMCK